MKGLNVCGGMSIGVSSQFADTFRRLESDGMLNPLNEVDIFCLHFTYLPRINKVLKEFQESWNNHGLSTEGNLTPYQLFTEGFVVDKRAPVLPVSTSSSVSSSQLPTVVEHVQVPLNKFKPCPTLQSELQAIDPLQGSTDNGRSIYVHTIHVLGNHLQSCGNCTLD